MLRFKRDYFVVDIDDQNALLFLTGNHRLFRISRELGDRLRLGPEHLEPQERDAWQGLSERGAFSDENRELLATSSFEDGADLAINVNLTNICNLACTYCFADGGDYGRITNAMGEESVGWIFDFIAANVTPSRRVRFEFFGGEPLANYKTMRDICEKSVAFAAEHDVEFVYRVSTNLTLLPKGAVELFAEHRFIVSVSLDGGRAVQDANRPSKNGRGSFDRIIANVREVRAAGDDVTLVARMTIAQREPTLIDSVRELWELNLFDYFQIYPGVFPADVTTAVPVTVTMGNRELVPASSRRVVNFFLRDGMVEQFRNFLTSYPSLFTAGNRFKGVLEYERTIQMVAEGLFALSFCSGGRTYFTHSPDSSISSCHRLVGDQSFDVGTGPEGLTRPPADWRTTVDSHPVCGGCWARYVCGGGCKQENFADTGDIATLNTDSCQYQLLLTEEVLRLIGRSQPEYLEQDRSPFADLFVSCGRPTMANNRGEIHLDERLTRLFAPVGGVR
ncbi:SPASM domain-containing protein [Actinoplanes sp. KI2]|uniref:radical SAM/SPASM domain-containing protein n=1 Tax=Actinoplanes sp. KI2 TaxID=2983315 RepID=UPI0021D58163|nr:radical SAM protein [Actinoplanes sp. KI2]MCU7725980.1 SPASM domain-containing protein [Actinoplanes sp. KI2]